MVDPNLILDYGSSLKDDFYFPPVDPFGDLINCNDDQLENIILGSGLCGENTNPWPVENEFDFEDLLKEIKITPVNQVERIEPKPELVDESELLLTINETEIANFEEVYSCSDEGQDDVSSENTQREEEESDNFSVESRVPKTVNTRKRKVSDISDVSSVSVASAPKRRRKARRNRRVQDERVKNQNKVAAMKYREKKKTEKETMEELMEIEVNKNTKLKASVEELKVNIDVLKELLGKYLTPSQLRFKSK